MKKKSDHVPGIVLSTIFTAISLAFIYLLYDTKMIPQTYMTAIIIVLALFILITGYLVWKFQRKIRFTIGTLLILVITIVLLLGSSYIYKTTSTLERISGVKTETAQIGIYVKNDDSAESVTDTSDYEYGVLQSLDRTNTDETITQLNEELNTDIKTNEFAGLSELVDGLLNGATDAIIINQAYLDVLEDMGYADLKSQLRKIDQKMIETEIETAPTETANNSEMADESGTDSEKPAVNSDEDAAKSNQATTTKKPSIWNTFGSNKIYTIFISGIDNRGDLIAKSRSDVNIIATVNTETRQIFLVSTPRDYFVPLSISKGVPDKLTHAGIYGINVCMDTLGLLYDMDINYYFRINFKGFINIIDALGGITVVSDYEFSSKNEAGFQYKKGENEVNGESALAFARERYAFKEGDRQRGKNQMAVIKGVINKALSPDLLKNYSSILKAVEGSFETNIAYEEIAAQLQRQLKNGGNWNVVTYSVDGTGATKKPYSMSQAAYVMEPDQKTVEKAKELMKKVRDGEIITQEDATNAGSTDNAETTDNAAEESADN